MITSPNQWIKETRRAHDVLVERHGFSKDVFVSVTDEDVIHLRHHDYYPDEWESEPDAPRTVKIKEMVKRDCIPEGLILFLMPESQCKCSNCTDDDVTAPIYMDPIMMLERIEEWDRTHKNKV